MGEQQRTDARADEGAEREPAEGEDTDDEALPKAEQREQRGKRRRSTSRGHSQRMFYRSAT